MKFCLFMTFVLTWSLSAAEEQGPWADETILESGRSKTCPMGVPWGQNSFASCNRLNHFVSRNTKYKPCQFPLAGFMRLCSGYSELVSEIEDSKVISVEDRADLLDFMVDNRGKCYISTYAGFEKKMRSSLRLVCEENLSFRLIKSFLKATNEYVQKLDKKDKKLFFHGSFLESCCDKQIESLLEGVSLVNSLVHEEILDTFIASVASTNEDVLDFISPTMIAHLLKKKMDSPLFPRLSRLYAVMLKQVSYNYGGIIVDMKSAEECFKFIVNRNMKMVAPFENYISELLKVRRMQETSNGEWIDLNEQCAINLIRDFLLLTNPLRGSREQKGPWLEQKRIDFGMFVEKGGLSAVMGLRTLKFIQSGVIKANMTQQFPDGEHRNEAIELDSPETKKQSIVECANPLSSNSLIDWESFDRYSGNTASVRAFSDAERVVAKLRETIIIEQESLKPPRFSFRKWYRRHKQEVIIGGLVTGIGFFAGLSYKIGLGRFL